jgi:hypothetical protein
MNINPLILKKKKTHRKCKGEIFSHITFTWRVTIQLNVFNFFNKTYTYNLKTFFFSISSRGKSLYDSFLKKIKGMGTLHHEPIDLVLRRQESEVFQRDIDWNK